MPRGRVVLSLCALALGTVVAPALASPAVARPSQTAPTDTRSELGDVAEALRRSPVHVDPEAERALTDSEAEDLTTRIRDEGGPVFVAVLPASVLAEGGPDQLVIDLAQETGLGGTYAVVVGDAFRATSTELTNADELATAAFQARSGDGTLAVLEEFVARAASEGRTPGSGTGPTAGTDATSGGSGEDDAGSGSLVPLAVLAAGGGGLLVWASRRRRRRVAEEQVRLDQEMAADRQMLHAELSVLSDDVLRLEPQVTMTPAARTDYDAAVERYRIAQAALDYADEPIDLVRLQRVVDEAQYAMSRARAIVEGRTPPPPPDELRRPGRHQEPPLEVDPDGVPVYAGGTSFYGGGWYGGGMGGGGLFSGLLLGSMLGGFGPFGMWGGGGFGGGDHGDGGSGDGGGWGGDGGWGGGLGGGDWGGGGFGGGDIGGGDW